MPKGISTDPTLFGKTFEGVVHHMHSAFSFYVRSIIPVACFALFSVSAQGQELGAIDLQHDDHGVFDQDLLPAGFHRERREKLREMLPAGGMAVFFANPIRNRSNDVDYEYHQDPNFYYLSGHREPNAMLLIFKDSTMVNGERTNELLVVQPRDPKQEIWEGRKLGTAGARERLGFRHVITGDELKGLTIDPKTVQQVFEHATEENLKDDLHREDDLHSLLEHWRDMVPGLTDIGSDTDKLKEVMGVLREVKTEQELELLRKAINITCEAQNELMRQLQPNMHEYQTEAIVEYVFKKNGAEHEGFPSIQGGGPHSCVLHYVTNRRELGNGDLLVSDIGAEYHGYTADVTRTLPANGTFTAEQRAIYDLVLEAQETGIQAAVVGAGFWAPHKVATQVITKGLKELGIIKSEADVRRYFMHGTSHYLGLDVHDPGTYGPLKANSVITVEPGIYIAESSPCDPKWWDIGIRIEDDILITVDGPENLSSASPRTAVEIEAMMKEGKNERDLR